MKKILFLALLVMGYALSTSAQSATTMSLTAGDTVVNSGTADKVIKLTGGYAGIAITAIATEISGTSAGTIQLWSSPDGVNYDSLSTAYTVTDVASQSKTFYVTAPVPVYIKVLQTGSGTMSSKLTVKYVIRKYQTQ